MGTNFGREYQKEMAGPLEWRKHRDLMHSINALKEQMAHDYSGALVLVSALHHSVHQHGTKTTLLWKCMQEMEQLSD